MIFFRNLARLLRREVVVGIPTERRKYVGLWKGENLELSIASDGEVRFRQSKTVWTDGNSSTSCRNVSGPIALWDGPSFAVGVPGSQMRFQVDAEPTEDGRMTVNGLVLKREEEAADGWDTR